MSEQKSIEILVNENFLYAKVLEYFGVEYYKSKDKTLQEVCKENKIDEHHLIEVFESSHTSNDASALEFNKYPARLIIAYLKHSHQHFVKDRLPSILKQVSVIESEKDQELINDLKLVLPMFIEDFVHHIFEEEDRLFNYISALESFIHDKVSATQIQSKINAFSIQEFALHHSDSDGEMSGIRGITNNYKTDSIQDLKLQVLYQELSLFDKELAHHASIENDVLFPKAILLEKQAKEILNTASKLN